MRVAHWCGTFSARSETFIYDLVLELARQGVDNHILTYGRENAAERPFDPVHVFRKDPLYRLGRTYHRLLALRELGKARIAAYWPPPADAERVLRAVQPDVIHAQFGHRAVSVTPLAQRLGIPLIVTFHGYDLTALATRPGWKPRYRRLYKQAAVLHGVSTHICDRLIALGAPPDKVKRHYIGIDLSRFPLRPPLDPPAKGEAIRCLHVGRLVEKKSPLKLVEAFAHARSLLGGSPPLRLAIAGDGPLLEATKARAAALGVADAVEVLGSVPHAQVAELLRESHLYTQHCLTAADGDQEGLGMTFLEASAVGLPIVATCHGGVPDAVLDGTTGILVDEGDTAAMGRAIAELATDPARRQALADAGRRHVEEHFDLQKQVAKLRTIYAEAGGTHP